jgi:hypothetical protein
LEWLGASLANFTDEIQPKMAKKPTAQSSDENPVDVLELLLEKPDDPTPVKVQVWFDPAIPKVRMGREVLEPKLVFAIAMDKVLNEEEAARCPALARMSKEDALAIIAEAVSKKAGWLRFF